ncbi:DUF6470 family protein [Bacillus sp. PK3_68]|uniref:DUF6470 family protein n=1 Tax=Bacillus sp. PK3_68 TaxID=2027408 RepID=UPI000E732391|nr:DUF6470 family protein [Bacillus sp. PK3_68]RJS60540.1 hypothetical protein CJ483_11040 [Bacillus sp. PK3_68]
MQLPQIRLQSNFAQIELNTKPAEQSIEQPRAELDLQQPPAEMMIDRTPSKLSIDQTQAWEDMDLKHIFRRIEEYADNGYQDWYSGVARRAGEGDELMKIENNRNPIASQAKTNSERPEYSFNIGFIPSPFSVNINFEPAKLNIEWKINKVINNTKAQKPVIDYQPGEVMTSLKQPSSLNVDFANLKFKGLNYEQEI